MPVNYTLQMIKTVSFFNVDFTEIKNKKSNYKNQMLQRGPFFWMVNVLKPLRYLGDWNKIKEEMYSCQIASLLAF